ncbi:DUF885 family protein [Sphingomonas sp. LHG3406-1]|uniref:DUF885 domain-containing protein n=1 Tax=Sphingomonas sp. LHG3406-1 TaxID=2804617 RepID=UPI00260B19A2|nr:DUF885 domain-containing protein [Sphingomonas sp. LHG3406-1]
MRRIALLTAFLLAGCATNAPIAGPPAAPPVTAEATASAAAPIPESNAELAAFFEAVDKAELALSPQGKTVRGIRDEDYGRWDERTDAAAERSRALRLAQVEELKRRFPRASLSPADQLSYDLFLARAEQREMMWPWRKYGYVFDQMNGFQSQAPAFLINQHQVRSVADAEAYVSRLTGLAAAIDQSVDEAESRAKLGVVPPRWVFPFVIADSRNIVKGAPFGAGEDSPLWADFKGKIARLEADEPTKARLLDAGRTALTGNVGPAYGRLVAAMERHQRSAPTDDGIWRFERGAELYRALLKQYTTTDLTPDQIHELGLAQVARIHGEMNAIREKVGFKGDLKAFFAHIRDGRQFFFSNDAAGRQRYLDESAKVQAEVLAALPSYFGRLPRSPLTIKAVEPFREKSAGKAFYQRPAPDGSRPGTYYVNLYDMREMPAVEVDALYCHEGLPGHHLQGALAVETPAGTLPPFRMFGGYTAHSEGWGLYAEKLCKEMGLYQDPYRDFGRLQLELHRAMRLVVDSGIHHKRWSRAQAIRYIEDNSADRGIPKAIERYIVYPGQATAYMVGKLKIEELRAKAEAALGPRFDVRGFHDTVLGAGGIPLDVLEARVDEWIAMRRG